MSNIIWGKIFLKTNPFSIIPDKESKGLIWAGFQSNKKLIETAIKNIYSSRDTKIVLNVSRWGGGKTHSAYYFSNSNNIKPLLMPNDPVPLSVIIITSKEGNNAPYDFFKKILDSITLELISATIKFMRTVEGEDESLAKIKSLIGSEPLAKVTWLLGSNNEEDSFEASEMLFNGTTTLQRKKYKLIRGVEDTTDRFKILSTIFKILSEYDKNAKFIVPRKTFLWMDEIESLIVYTPKQYIPFTQAIRELVDMTPSDFCLLMNFSLSDYDNLRALEYIIGKALSDRISFRNVFTEPSNEEAFSYVQELLRSYRTDNFTLANNLYPFNQNSLNYLSDEVMSDAQAPLMPRNVNKYAEYVIDKAFQENILIDNKEITTEFISSLNFKELKLI